MRSDELEEDTDLTPDHSPVSSRQTCLLTAGINCFTTQKNSMSKEQLQNEFFMMERRVKELEDMVLKQQEELKASRDKDCDEVDKEETSLGSDLLSKIQIHQWEIELLRKENKRLKMENQNLRGSGR